MSTSKPPAQRVVPPAPAPKETGTTAPPRTETAASLASPAPAMHADPREASKPPRQLVVPCHTDAATPCGGMVLGHQHRGWYLKPSAQRMVLGHQHRGWYLKPSRRDGTSSHQHSGWYVATSTEGGTSSHQHSGWYLATSTVGGTSSHQHSGWYLRSSSGHVMSTS